MKPMDLGRRLLSELVFYRTYPIFTAKGLRETRNDTIARVEQMHLDRFPALADEIRNAFGWVYSGHVRPSMRSFQFAGDPICRENVRMFNCAGQGLDNIQKFSDFLYILMCGTGQGFSVERRFIQQLPVIVHGHEAHFTIEDSKESWADSVRTLILNPQTQFNYGLIRARGTPLTTGGTASGPEPLRQAHERIRDILKTAKGRKLLDVECADIVCMLAEVVVVGGVRRAALICLFDADSVQMLNFKSGRWWETHPWRARTNVSARLSRSDDHFEDKLRSIVTSCFANQSGEPGLSLMNDQDWFYNPCHEVALKAFCNLTSVNAAACRNRQELLLSVRAATLIGVLQKNYTSFHYISRQWQIDCEQEALLGVSFTGLALAWGLVSDESLLSTAASIALDTDEHYSRLLGMPQAARIGTIKPSGTESAELGVTSGIHAAHSGFYTRRVRIERDSAIADYLLSRWTEGEPGSNKFIERDAHNEGTLVVSFPVAHENGIIRSNETSIQLLERCKYMTQNWILPTHRRGPNPHNVSVTVSYKPQEHDDICNWMVANRNSFSGISLLPDDGGNYLQAPFESLSRSDFEMRTSELPREIDFSQINGASRKSRDDRFIDWACAGDSCEPS
jgi:ribonucleoside-diphosphate reductase alpha chain